MAAAAGFVAVAGVMVVLQQAAPGGNGFDAPQMAATPPAAVTVRASVGAAPALAGAPATVQRGQMLRDARIDEYLRAHREVLMGSPAALPGGAVRTVDFEAVPSR
jgi:sigma-E factor negative regulatory protein RseA